MYQLHSVICATSFATNPLMVSEQQINTFRFHLTGAIVEGMRFQNELYGLICELDSANRLEAYNLACALTHQGEPAIISISEQQYKVWMSLRSSAYAQSHDHYHQSDFQNLVLECATLLPQM